MEPQLNLDVSELLFDDKAVPLIVGSLSLEAHNAAFLRGVTGGTIEDQLPLVFSILDGHLSDLLDVRHVPTTQATCFASVVFGVSSKAYGRFALAAQNGEADLINANTYFVSH
jgi:hypothetical protein